MNALVVLTRGPAPLLTPPSIEEAGVWALTGALTDSPFLPGRVTTQLAAQLQDALGRDYRIEQGLDGGGTTLVFTLPADLERDEDSQGLGDTTSAEPPPRRRGSETAVS